MPNGDPPGRYYLHGRTAIEGNTFRDVSHAIPHAGDDTIVRDNEFSGTDIDLVLDGAINATVTDNAFVTGIQLDGVPEDLDANPHEMSENTVGGDPLVYAVDEDAPRSILVPDRSSSSTSRTSKSTSTRSRT